MLYSDGMWDPFRQRLSILLFSFSSVLPGMFLANCLHDGSFESSNHRSNSSEIGNTSLLPLVVGRMPTTGLVERSSWVVEPLAECAFCSTRCQRVRGGP